MLIASRFFRRFASNREAPTSAVAAGPADYERESLQALKDRLDRNLVIVDVGYRWGFAESWDQLSPNVTLYGFDPMPRNASGFAHCTRAKTSRW